MLETLLRPNDTDERCGFLLTEDRIAEVENIAPDPTKGFEMNPAEALGYIIQGDVVATWHTHPDGQTQLSGEDYNGFLAWPDLFHYVIGPDGIKKYRVEDGAVLECD